MIMQLFKKSSDELIVGGHSFDVLSVIRDRKVLLTSRTARTFPKDHVEPRIIEIMFGTHSGSPIFAYYLCPAYHAAAVEPAGAAAFGGHHRTEQFRMAVSESIASFLNVTIQHHPNLPLSYEIESLPQNQP